MINNKNNYSKIYMMSKLVESITKCVYIILYGTSEYDKYGITPVVKINEGQIKIITPHSNLFSADASKIQDYRREMRSMILLLKGRYEEHILSGDNGYYKIPASDDLKIKRIEDYKGFHYKVYIPFIKLIGYQDYLDMLPDELLRIIFIKSQLGYHDSQDSFSKLFNSSYFSWKGLFQELYPKAYETAVTISGISEEKDWMELYDMIIQYKLIDFTININQCTKGDVVLRAPSGRWYSTKLRAYKGL